MSSIVERIESFYAQFVRDLTHFPNGAKRTNLNHKLCKKFIQDIHEITLQLPNTMSVDPKIFVESVAVLEYLQPKATREEGMVAVIKQTNIVLFLLYKVYDLVLENEKLKAENAKFLETVRTLELRYRDSLVQPTEAPLKDLANTGELPSASALEKNEIQEMMHSNAFKYSVISILSIFASKGFISLDVSKWEEALESNYQEKPHFIEILAQIEGNKDFSKIIDEEEKFQIDIQKLFAEVILIDVQIVNSFTLMTLGTITYHAFPHFMIGGLVASVIYIAFTNPSNAAEYANAVFPIISIITANYTLK